jgi:hypothetical protein
VRAAAARPRLPIRFDSLAEELDFWAAAAMLDFGSGYDPLLEAKGLKPAHDVAEYGLLGLAMRGAPLTAAAMAAFTKPNAADAFGVDPGEERPVEGLPGVTMTSPGALAPFVGALASALAETGRILVDGGHASLGAFVLAQVAARAAAGRPPSAAALVEDLAESFPIFDDRSVAGAAVFHRKAQALAGALHARFAAEDARFAFADADALAGDSGAAALAALVDAGVVALAPALAEALAGGRDLAGDAREPALRAAAVAAADAVCAAAGGAFVPRQLAALLLREARRGPAWAAARRHVNRGTTAY